MSRERPASGIEDLEQASTLEGREERYLILPRDLGRTRTLVEP